MAVACFEVPGILHLFNKGGFIGADISRSDDHVIFGVGRCSGSGLSKLYATGQRGRLRFVQHGGRRLHDGAKSKMVPQKPTALWRSESRQTIAFQIRGLF
jgi:hypothetical protein